MDEITTKQFEKVTVFKETVIHPISFGKAGKRRVILKAGIPIKDLAKELKCDPKVILEDEDLKPFLTKIEVEVVPETKSKEPEKPVKSGK
jgi:hypothetical protein